MATKQKTSTHGRGASRTSSKTKSGAAKALMNGYPLTTDQILNEITRRLEKASGLSHRRINLVFVDWLDMLESFLDQLPAHVRMLRATHGKQLVAPEDEPEEIQALWQRLRKDYSPACFELLSEAAWCLLFHAPTEYYDYLGSAYMSLGVGNPRAGQYFTPWNVAYMMAQMCYSKDEEYLLEQIKQALLEDPIGQALLLGSVVFMGEGADALPSDAAFTYFIETLLPVALQSGKVKPIRICDPACGSGVFLLAAAASYSPWLIQAGLVQFFGMDIDLVCVKAARLNMRLYGLNGYGAKLTLACLEGDDPTLPELVRAKAAQSTPEPMAPASESEDQAADLGADSGGVTAIPIETAIRQRKQPKKQKQKSDRQAVPTDLTTVRAKVVERASKAPPGRATQMGLFGNDKAA